MRAIKAHVHSINRAHPEADIPHAPQRHAAHSDSHTPNNVRSGKTLTAATKAPVA